MSHRLFTRILRPLFALILLGWAGAPAGAAVTTFHYYRMGEDDNRTSPPTVTKDHLGNFDLTRVGGTLVQYKTISSGSDSWWLEPYNGGFRGPTPISTLTDNFGIEAWILLYSGAPGGARCIAYNGNTAVDGWGLYANGNTVSGFYGGLGNVGSATIPTGQWTHVALVRNNGTATLYVNGVASGSAATPPRPPTSVFALGIRPQTDGEFLYGAIDEVRFFAFTAGQFLPGDLLLNIPEIILFRETGQISVDVPRNSAVDFGTMAAGTSVTQTWGVGNYGRGALTTNMTIDGPDAASFQVVPLPGPVPGPTGISPEAAIFVNFTVKFVPQGGGPRTATLHIANNDLDENPYDVVLTGTGTGNPDIDVQQPAGTSRASGSSSVDLGAVTVGNTTAPTTFTIRDTAPAELLLSSVTVTGGDASNFTVNTTGMATTVPGNGQTTFTVTFTPSGNGPKSTTLRIASNDPDENPYTITLTGTGQGAEVAVFNGAGTAPGNARTDNVGVVAFPATFVATSSATQTFTIQNAGTLPLTAIFMSRTGANPNDFVLGGYSGTLGPGQSAPFTVTFTPTARGTRTATISIASNDEDENPFEVNLSGVGIAPDISIEQIPGAPLTADGHVFAWGTPGFFGRTNPPPSLAGVVAVAAGGNHSLALLKDGSVVAWGETFRGQCDVPAGALSGVVAIAAGQFFSMALKADGTVLVWGNNDFGQTNIPAAATTGVKAIAAGGSHGVVLKNDGTVIAWGGNTYGQSAVPGGLTGVQAITANLTFTTAVKSDGSVVSWGLPFGTPPTGLAGAQISAGNYHVLARKADGTVVAWGDPGSPQISIPPAAATGVQAVAAGGIHSLALKTDGSVIAWGDNWYGQSNLPADLLRARSISENTEHSLAVGVGEVDYGHLVLNTSLAKTFTIKNAGLDPLTVNSAGVTGGQAAEFAFSNATSLPAVLAPGGQFTVTVTFTPSATGVRGTTLRVLSNDGDEPIFDVALTGNGDDPEITMFKGIGTSPANALSSNGPAIALPNILAGSAATQFFTIQNTGIGDLAGISYSVTGGNPGDFTLTVPPLTSLGPDVAVSFSVTCRPLTVGDRTATISIVSNDRDENPFQIQISATAIAPDIVVEQPAGTPLETGKVVVVGSNVSGQANVPVGLFGTKVIAAGSFFTLALQRDGTVAGWGDNFFGQCNVPSGLRDVTAIAAGESHSLALKSDGTVVAWGRNAEGQCNVPGGLTGVVAIAAGGYTSVALKSDGSWSVWGSTADGQNNIPAAATSGVTAIDAGEGHVLARKSDGSVVAWGRNTQGQATVPAAALANVKAISAGVDFSVALKTDGTVVAWGANNYGQCNVPSDLTNVDSLAAGSTHVVALRNDGTTRCWGNNDVGQLLSSAASGYSAVAAGRSHTALLSNPKITFPGSAVGSPSAPKTFTVKNTGNATLNLGAISVTGGQAIEFSVNTTGTATVLAPGGQTTFTATCTPAATGPRHATLRIPSDDPDEAPFDLELTGSGAYPNLVLEYPFGAAQPPGTGSVVLGNQFMGSPSGTLTFYIHNTSSAAPLTINSVTTVGGNASEFTVSTAHLVSPVSVYTGFDVTFSSSAIGPRTTTLRVTSNDPAHTPYDITLTGPGLTPVEAWRLQQFGNPFANGDEANTADYDRDGIPNLIEYGFNLNPKLTNTAAQLPQPFLSGGFYVYEFPSPPGVAGVTYGAEWSTTLQPSDWHAIPDTGNASLHHFGVPITGEPKMFVRLKVMEP